jgi:hypothetical protein
MAKAKIFIASSGRALVLAEELRNELSTDYCEATIWSDESKDEAGNTIIEMLEQASKAYNFAVIILTRDDMVFKDGGDSEQLKARDNCVFEAGLFMGAQGRESCFLVTSVSDSDLPTDLRGIIYKKLAEPDELHNHRKCKEAITILGSQIKGTVQNQWKIKEDKVREQSQQTPVPFISATDLFAKEKLIYKGGELEEGQIVINAVQPPETSHFEFAVQVKDNLIDGVKYTYFFHANEDGAQKICMLLQSIIVAPFVDSGKVPSFKDRYEVIKQRGDDALKFFQGIKDQLNIYFLAEAPSFQFSIHNATNPSTAKAYIKYKEGYLIWGGDAHEIWTDLKKCRPLKGQAAGVFLPTLCINLKEIDGGKFKASLDDQFKRYFPGIAEKVMELCYGY